MHIFLRAEFLSIITLENNGYKFNALYWKQLVGMMKIRFGACEELHWEKKV